MFYCLAAAARGTLHNLYQRSYLPGPFWSGRAVTTVAVAILLFSGLCLAFRLRTLEIQSQHRHVVVRFFRACVNRPEQVFFFLPMALLTALLAVELRSGLVTVGWSALGVAAFLVALPLGERSFRLAGLGLLLLGVAKIILVDVWNLTARDRYLTLIIMGSALLLVSFLYSRYRQVIRKYL